MVVWNSEKFHEASDCVVKLRSVCRWRVWLASHHMDSLVLSPFRPLSSPFDRLLGTLWNVPSGLSRSNWQHLLHVANT